jgi:hypothetical protein
MPAPLAAKLSQAAQPVPGVEGLRVTPSLLRDFGDSVESAEVLEAVVEVYSEVQPHLARVLAQRVTDRNFLDAAAATNAEILGLKDGSGRVVMGPAEQPVGAMRPVDVPEFMSGPQITLFGPPDSEKMCVNALNSLHRKMAGEIPLVAKLVAQSGVVPRWGADSEDSMTPLGHTLKAAAVNLRRCFDRSISVRGADGSADAKSALAAAGLALPHKRVAGLALPDGDHLLGGAPLPLHVVELVQHVWLNRDTPEARVVYFPKLENEEEAAYLAQLLGATERAVARRFPDYPLGSLRTILVFENPRAIFRIREMAEALHPYFLGGSLGWHDFLASTARTPHPSSSPRRISLSSSPTAVLLPRLGTPTPSARAHAMSSCGRRASSRPTRSTRSP